MVKIHSLTIKQRRYSFKNYLEFVSLYKDIFILKQYYFQTNKNRPLILDCGSHFGLSIIYFKTLYPWAKVLGFEPDPSTFELLKVNTAQNNLQNVTLINAAVASTTGSLYFYTQKNKAKPAWGNSLISHKHINGDYEKIKVPAVKLSDYINSEVDLLKLDIEGSELIVLEDILPKLYFVKEIILELHLTQHNRQKVCQKIFMLLENHDFMCQALEIGRIKGKPTSIAQIAKSKAQLFVVRAHKNEITF